MIAYRIANCLRAGDMNGVGAKLFGGRWNSVGVPMHYMAATRALAALEVLANKSSIVDVDNLCLATFELPEDSMETIDVDVLPQKWQLPMEEGCRKFGDAFVKGNKSLLLKVPSALISDEYNYLMNVNHPLAQKVKLLEIKRFSFDSRLL